MYGNRVITIGREFGSGGRTVGGKLAKRLGVKLYDKELITMAAEQTGMSEEVFQTHDEKPVSSFFYSLVMDTHSTGPGFGGYNMPLNQKVFLAQFEAIQKLAEQESCIIVGRCADYALSSYPNTVNVFLCADLEDKVKRIAEMYNITNEKALEMIPKTDKKRANYYNYYSSKKWGNSASYDLCINTSRIGTDGAVEVILAYLEQKDKIDQKAETV